MQFAHHFFTHFSRHGTFFHGMLTHFLMPVFMPQNIFPTQCSCHFPCHETFFHTFFHGCVHTLFTPLLGSQPRPEPGPGPSWARAQAKPSRARAYAGPRPKPSQAKPSRARAQAGPGPGHKPAGPRKKGSVATCCVRAIWKEAHRSISYVI